VRRRQIRVGQVGQFWPSKKPGREGPDDPYCLTWYDESARQTRRESLGTADFQEACLLVAEHAVRRDPPRDARPEDVPISTCLLKYWDEHGKDLISCRHAKRHSRLWTEFWGDKTVAEITLEAQTEFRKFLGEGRLKPSTVDKALQTGKAALNHANRAGILTHVPRIVLIETEEDRRDREPMGIPITPAIAARFIDKITNPRLLMFTMILANTLARPQAVYDLRRAQFDHEVNTIRLNPPGRRQTKKFRPLLPVTPTLRPWLMSVSDPLEYFVAHDGEQMKALRGSWESTVRHAGLPPGYTPYSFRHGLAGAMREYGVPSEQIDYFLGHAPRGGAKTTYIYAPMKPHYCKQAVAAIEAFMEEVRQATEVIDIDDPSARLGKIEGRMFNGRLDPNTRQDLLKAVLEGQGVMDLARRFKVSTTLVYKYRKKLLGRTRRK
jgi:integrase